MKTFDFMTTENVWPGSSLSPVLSRTAFEDFDQLVESFLQPTFSSSTHFQPSCDLTETQDHYLVSFDMPGVKKDDIKIEVKGQELFISGERSREVKKAEGKTHHMERLYGKFERRFKLPETVMMDKIEAQHENGVLNIAIPKAEAAKPRTIQIQAGQGSFLSKLLGGKKEENELKDVESSKK